MTYTELINAVLRRLREDEVSAPNSSTYATLIGDLVNEAKREVEDAWDWNALRTTVQIDTVQGTSQYSVTNSGKRFRTLSVYDGTNMNWLRRKHHMWMTDKLIQDSANNNYGVPIYYDYNDIDSNGDRYVDFYAIPDGVYSIYFNLVIPQDDFTEGNESLEVPDYPVLLGAYAKAVAERGEDQGRTHGEAVAAYQLALSDAIAYDNDNLQGEDTWHV